MILNAKYTDKDGTIVWLNEMDGPDNVFYTIGSNLIHATLEFFQSRYKLIR